MDPTQQLALYRAQFPGQLGTSFGAPQGSTPAAGQAAGIGKIIAALMQQRAMQAYQQKYGPKTQQQQQPIPGTVPPVDMAQGQTLSSSAPGIGDGSSAPGSALSF